MMPTWTHWDVGKGVSGYTWAADRPRAMLMLQHGFGEYAERFVDDHGRLIPRLCEAGISVFAFDMRGHGRSPGQRGIVDVEDEARRHVAARRSLSWSTRPFFLMGHSLGGLVTAASVLMEPAGIDGVILSSPAFARHGVIVRWFIERIARISPEWRAAKSQPPAGLSRDEEAVRRFVEDPLIFHGGLSAIMAASSLRLAHRVHEEAPLWSPPTLIVHGSDDPFTSALDSAAVFGRMAVADKTFELVENGRHELLNDLSSEDILTLILGWLDARSQRAGHRRPLRWERWRRPFPVSPRRRHMTDLSGTYDVVANSPMGDQKMTMTIKVDGDAFTGTSTGAMGSSDLSGTVAGDTITWRQAITVPMPLTLECEATIVGDELSGKVDTGVFGSFPLSGRRTA